MVTSDLTGFRLSPQQEHLWRAQGSRPAPGFVCQGLLELRGPLDRGRLRRAVERLVERHEILRTAFPLLPGMSLPIQVIQDRGRVLWDEPEAAAAGEAEIERLLAEARRLAVPRDDGTALQACLVSPGAERHLLLLTLPGLAADALSLRILADEIAALYDGGGAEALDPLQYADAAESLQDWLGPEEGPGAAFWRQQSLSAPAPAEPGEPAVPETVRRSLAAEAVTGLGHRMGVPLPRLLLAAWSAALWWETGEERQTIAVAFDGRTFDDLAQAVGLYVRYLPLQPAAGAGLPLGELARRLDDALSTAALWQDAFSPDRLAAGPAAEGAAPLWPFGFDSHRTAVLSPALSLRPAYVGLGRFALRLSVIEDGAAVLLDLHYDPSLSDRRQAERLLERLERVLAGAAAGDVPLGEMDVLTDAERREILVGFNDTAAPYPATATAADLFEEQARRTPHAPAVLAGGISLTFGELDARANRLARHLRALGIGPEARVGLLLEREPEMVVALLAVLKAGGAYVPLDAGHPPERLRFLIEDAGLAVLIDAGGAAAAAAACQDEAPLPRLAGPGNAAYVIYTSGSTGRPKGVVVTHRGLVNYLWWARTAYAAGAAGGAPVHSPLGFDLTVTSLFVPLLAGAAITLLPEEDGIGALAEALRRERFGLAKITPAHLGLLRQLAPEGEDPPSANCLVLGGDALWAADIAPWRRRGTRIFNEYGPTETVVGCCVHEVGPESPETGAVPIGRPIANTRLYLMGPGLQPTPAGVPGELWIGGDGVARGYLGRPDLTAERFVPDPFAPPDQAGGRLYRTGDLVRYSSPETGLEFLGRIDDQVKIRGHRIEPGEVAAALAAHPGLRDAAVALRGAGDDRRLVAWVVARDRARRPSAADLRAFLAERLPAPMIPAAFVHLDILPLTANGKLDRRALPDPDHQRDEEAPYAPPRTLAEEMLAEIWSQVLGVDRVGIDDPFFSVGGDSIRSLQVLALAQKRGLAVTLQDLFQKPTIRGLAERVHLGGRSEAAEASAPFSLVAPADRARLPEGLEDAYPLARLQAGMLFHAELDPGSAVYHDQHSFHARAPFSLDRMRAAVAQVARLHPVLRTSFDLASYGESLQLVHPGVEVPLAVHDLRQVPPGEQEAALAEWLRQERLEPFDWTEPPLLALHVHLRGEESFQFTMSFHHAILDGWSAASLLADLFRRYALLLRGEELPPDAPLAVTYRDFVALERAAAASEEARGFWSRRLDGAEPTRLPRSAGPAGAGPAAGAREIHTRVDPALSDGARRAARAAEVPLKSLLLAVHLKVAGVLGGTRDVLTGLVSHGRSDHADGERVLGLFLNTLPFRAPLHGGTWSELAREAFELEREMLPFRSFPLAEVRGLESGLQRLETAFNYLHYHVYRQTAEIRDIEVLGYQGYEETNVPLITHAVLDPFSQEMQLSVAWRAADLDAGEAGRFSAYLLRALAALVDDPSARHDAAVLLSPAELAQVLDGAAGPGEPLPVEPLHHRFEEWASRAPAATALVCAGRRMSYGELETAANRLARHLRSLGVGPEVRVAVLLERSLDLVVALLAILKAGGAYVPLDPAYPAERSAFILADSGAAVLVTEDGLARSLPSSPLRCVRLDADREQIAARPAARPAIALDPGNAAYVIYTSGSTGTPKGVQVTHANVARLLAATDESFGFGPEDVWTFFHSVAFDFSVWEIWGALLYGGRLVVVPHAVTRSPGDFHALLAAESVTVLNQTPSAFQQLSAWEQEAAAAPELSLRLVIFGGEALHLASLRPWFERHGDVRPRLVNMYGITETTVHVTFRPMAVADLERGGSPIGGPIPDLRLSLLAAEGTPAPPGVPGEIHVGGAGLARGYLGRPALTAERFVPDPFGSGAGERLYRSGDLARRQPDGSLEYLGRIDHQVKIRGFRIELGEIEAALAATAGVREAAVVARADRSAEGPGGPRLVAYWTGEIAAEALRQALRERLPDYMVPAAFVKLAELPLTPNGKVDRKALPEPERHAGPEGSPAPRTPVEEVLAGIWAELLGLERIGATDSFFDLGGHSLLATRVLSRLRAAFGVEMPLRDLFEAPVLADLAGRVEAALRAGGGSPAPPLAPVPREGPLPLSFSQQRLWFIDQLEPGSPLYNIPTALRVAGPLDGAVLACCLGEIVRRHEVLRTVFVATDGSPRQEIQPAAPFGLPVVDLSALPESAREALALRLTAAEAVRPFDLGDPRGGPLLRALLLRLAEEDHAVALTLHHIVSDGWSMSLLVREMAALYPAVAARRPSPLAELPVQYADFAVWQRSWLHGETLESEIHWWRRQLAGLPPLLELPTDRPRPAVQSFRGATRPVRLPAEPARRMAALARREGATLFMVLLAGFQALLARYSGQEDLAVGTPVAGRNGVETEGLIGFFVNTLVLRGDLAGRPSFRELLGRVRETALAAYVHQDVPFEKLVEELAPERSLSQTPLFQVMFGVQNAPAESLEIRDLRLRPMNGAGTTAKFDLTLAFEEHGDELVGAVEYAADLFDAATIDRLCGHFERLLDGLSDRPERSVEEAGLLTAEEALQLAGWNATARDWPRAGVHELFARQAERAPGAVAVLFGDRELTYGELDLRSRRLARRLRRRGVGPGALVGLCAERSPEMVVGMLGILAAGGAYVPLDPVYPQERLGFMLQDTGAGVLVAQEHLAGRLPAREGLRIEILEGAEEDPGPGTLPLVSVSPGDPAYVIYTSGSTGRPKGVVVPHGAIVRLVCETDYVQLGPQDRVAQAANSSFDATTFEVWGALLNGGRLVGIEREATLAPRDLVAALDRGGITALFLTTALFNQIAREEPGGFARLRYLLFGGELVDPAAVLAVLRAGPPEHLLHVYGPTETTTFASWHRVEAVPPGATVPIGRPLANGTLDVLGRGLLPLPVGVPGELYVGGDGLAHGYHARPELTAERFVPDPLSRAAGARLYRTGDLVRRRPDGAVEFLGRLDHQVKIRGFRVEPGEIEAALLALPGVREAVVVAREDTPGDRRLVAYVTGDAEPGALRRSFREELRERLPDYMVPAAFVVLAALPLSPNGKVDRKALPAPDGQVSGESHLAPRTPVEEVLAGIWAELLGLERVGANDQFFELGGHSLLATQAVSRLRGAFDAEISLRDLFEAPVLGDLAARVEAALRSGAHQEIPPLVPVQREGPPPLSFAQQRLWFLDQLEPGSPLYNIPAALRVEGPLEGAVLALTLGEILRRHEVLRTVFGVREGSPVQVIRPAAPFALPLVDLAALPERAREELARTLLRAEASRPFDLGRGPLLRALLLRLAPGDHVVALTLHHIVSDGWSMGILVREVAALYPAFAARRPSPLAELPVQYADFAVWQASWLRGEVLEREIGWWRQQLAGLPPLLELPTDRPRAAARGIRGATRPLRLPGELVRQARAVSRREGATLFMVLLAGLQVLLARSSGQDDLAVGSPVAGRQRIETEGLIGFFVNTLVLRGVLTGEPGFREVLGRVRETALAAYLHQDVPFEKLVEALAPDRSLAQTPLFQVMLVLQNAPAADLEVRDLRLRPLDVDGATAKFDLTLIFEEHGNSLLGAVEYATDLFDATTVDRLAVRLETLLHAALTAPELAVAELPPLSPAERHQLLVEWNDTAVPRPPEILLHDLLTARAAESPERIALTQGEEELTHGELSARSDRLAAHLRALGAGPDVVVALFFERSVDLVVSLLAVLKAGAAYLPLETSFPRARLSFLLDDARAALLLTRSRRLPDVPEGSCRVVCLDDLPDLPGRTAPGGPAVRPAADNLAYVLYTSGSTGRPKGVAVTHRGLANYVLWAMAAYPADQGRGAPVHSPVSFDLTVTSLFLPLLAGRSVDLVPEKEEIEGLAGALAAGGFGLVKLTPAHLEVLQRLLPPERAAGCAGAFVIGGEPLAGEQLAFWRTHAPGLRLINEYGPTETVVGCSAWEVPVPAPRTGRVSVGRPIANTRILILDSRLRPVPLGVPGELHVGGAGVSRGYLHRPAATAEAFVPDPFGTRGERLYRTGDLGRYLPDGTIELLGRADQQVKVRGFRIELGEIEAALAALPGVREAVVVAREDGPGPGAGSRRLVAYVVGDAAAEALGRSLRERLPDYMVPAAFVPLAALPLTANGKVDRKALPAPEWQGAGEDHREPRTPVEEVLAGIWAELLGLERVGSGDSFFDLGGHSLLATQVLSRLRGVFGIEMPLRDLFAAPLLADLAVRVEAALAGVKHPVFSPAPVPRERPLPLSFAQQRLWFIDQLEPGSPLYNMPVALRLRGPLRTRVLARCLGEIVRRHEVLRTSFLAVEGAAVQVARPAEPFSLAVVELSGLPERERETQALAAAAAETARPFDLGRGPLLRGVLLRLAAEDQIAVLTLHHIVSDGWSMGLLVREVTALYQAFLEEKPSPLPELPLQYADFAVWQRGWLDEEALEGLADAWQRRLAGAPPLPDLPGARPRPAALSPRGAACRRRLAAPLPARLRALGRSESATLFMTLLAPLQALLHSWTGAVDLVIGTDVAGRDRRETEGLIGFFINQLPLRADLSGDPTLRELLRRVRESALDAYAHQDLPFDHLVDALRVPRSLQRSPVFQVKLVLQNIRQEVLELPDLTLESMPLGTETSQLDLHWNIAEAGEELWLKLTYSTDLYDEPLIDRLLDDYDVWLRAFVERPEARLGEVAAEIAQAARSRRAGRGQELKTLGRGKLLGRRRPAAETTESET